MGSSPERRIAGPSAGYGAAFDRLFERGRDAVLAGTHYRDSPPVDGGRWGLSVVLPPDPPCAARLAAVTAEALAVAGPDHWPTGSPEAVHFTVRALEAHRSSVPEGDPLVARAGSALRRAAAARRPVRLALRGLTLTPSGVMACAYPVQRAPAGTGTAGQRPLRHRYRIVPPQMPPAGVGGAGTPPPMVPARRSPAGRSRRRPPGAGAPPVRPVVAV